jgi:signal peptidase I
MQLSSCKGRAIIRDSWLDTLWIAGPGILLFLALRALFPIDAVPSTSMEPTIRAGERVLVNKLHYAGAGTPQRGDIVQFDSGFRGGLGDREPVKFIKRVVAIPGDTVAIKAGQLVVNGGVVAEDYATPATEDYAEIDVPAEHYFVLGDNRDESYDSRFVGAIAAEQLQGRVSHTFSRSAWLTFSSRLHTDAH